MCDAGSEIVCVTIVWLVGLAESDACDGDNTELVGKPRREVVEDMRGVAEARDED